MVIVADERQGSNARPEVVASLRGVTFTYATASGPALIDVDLDVPADQLTLVCGPSSGGKSTLARMLAGFIPHHLDGTLEGTVTVMGCDLHNGEHHELTGRVGIVFDNPFDQLTGATRSVFDEAAFALENEGLRPVQIVSRVSDALEQVGLAHLADRHPRELSGGQSQRLAIASMLAQRKPLMVLDDPTSQLDPAGTAQIVRIAERLRADGISIVVVAQDLTHWVALADRLVVLAGGRVEAEGAPATLLADPAALRRHVLVPRHIEVWHQLAAAGIRLDPQPPLDVNELVTMLRSITGTETEDRPA